MGTDFLRRPAAPLLRGSKAEPTTSSRYSSFRGRERSLDPERLRRSAGHLQTNSASPKGLRRPSAFGSDWRRGKVRLAFRLYTASPVKDRPKYASLSVRQWLSRSGIPWRPLHVRWMQTCLRISGLAPPQSNLKRDCWSASRRALSRGSTANRYRIKGKTYLAHASALTFKDNFLESQIPPWALTLACNSDQFRSSWRSDLNHTPRMRMGPSL